MSDRDRAIAEQIAQHTTARILDALQDEDTAGRIVDKWAGKAQQVVGRVVIRTVFYIVGVALLIGSIKAGLVDWLVSSFGFPGSHK
jgi:hypothetical protein